jgi:hypothetical protein
LQNSTRSHLLTSCCCCCCLDLCTQIHTRNSAGDLQRQQIEQLRKADYQSLAAAKRAGQLATINFTLDLPEELSDVELSERWGAGAADTVLGLTALCAAAGSHGS